jgi:hypothetical protein
MELTKRLSIKTVPSTVILNRDKRIKFINNGFVSGKILKHQLKGLAENAS